MQSTTRALAAPRGSRGGAIRFRATWMTPGLSSHQMLDAGVAARQHGARKALKKSKRPFENYFKVEFRRSQGFRLPRIGPNGIVAASDAARLMTNPRENWRTPWDGTLWRLAKTRTDVVESAAPAFGDDPADAVVDQLLDIRFEWDKEDDVVGPSLVPESFYALTAHCAPYATAHASASSGGRSGGGSSSGGEPRAPLSSSLATSSPELADGGREDDDVVFLPDGTTLRMPARRRKPAYERIKYTGGHPKRTYRKPNLGFNGVDVVPSLVVDAVRGPLLSSSTEPVLTVRWKAANRRAESVARMLRLRRRLGGVVAVGLPPRVAQLLLKAAASEELEDPALEVSLAVAMGENYGGYSTAECLEVLRGLRRLALVRHLPALADSAGLYRDAQLLPRAFHAYVEDAAPFLVDRVWSHLPEHSRHLLHDQLYLDWLDLLSLAVELAGSARLPENLPNPSSKARYAAKYLFLRHTLGLDASVMTDMVDCLHASAEAAAASHPSQAHGSGLYVDDEKELIGRPLILWLAVSLLVRLVAEALGDVLRHVQQSLHDHAQLAAETLANAAATVNPTVEMNRFLDRIALARPLVVAPYRATVAGSRARRGGLRVRLLPFEAFPQVTQLRPAPFHGPPRGEGRRGAAAQRATTRTTTTSATRRHRSSTASGGASSSVTAVTATGARRGEAPPALESAFASIFTGSALLKKHVARATAALQWSTAVLRPCHRLVATLQNPPAAVMSGTGEAAFSGSASVSSAGPSTFSEPSQDGTAVHRRQLLCRGYVQSRVEGQLDALFLGIPWSDLLEDGAGLHAPWLSPPESADAPALATDATAPTPTPAPESDVSEAADQLAMMLDDDMRALDTPAMGESAAAAVDDALAQTETPPASSDDAPLYSEAELAMRAAMEGLHEALGEFEVVVADLLDAYEDFFDVPRKAEAGPPATSDS